MFSLIFSGVSMLIAAGSLLISAHQVKVSNRN